MLAQAIRACPDNLWSDPSNPPQWNPNGVAGFWYLAYHTLFFLDLQLSGAAPEFTPPPPFNLRELESRAASHRATPVAAPAANRLSAPLYKASAVTQKLRTYPATNPCATFT